MGGAGTGKFLPLFSMNKSILNILGIAILGAIGLSVWGGWWACVHLVAAIDSFGTAFAQISAASVPVSQGSAQTLAEINRPCQPIKGHIYKVNEAKPCGTLADIAQTLRTMRGMMGTIETAGNHENSQLSRYDAIATQTSDLLVSFRGTADAATGTAQETTAMLSSIRTTTDQLPPLIAASTASVNDLDALLKDKAIDRTLTNVDTSTANFAVVSGNFARVTTFYADDITKPKTFKEKMKAGVSLGFDALGFAFRHF